MERLGTGRARRIALATVLAPLVALGLLAPASDAKPLKSMVDARAAAAPASDKVVIRAQLVIESSTASATVRLLPGAVSPIKQSVDGRATAKLLTDGVEVAATGRSTTVQELFWRTDPEARPVLQVDKSTPGTVAATLSVVGGPTLAKVTNASGNTKLKRVEAVVPAAELRASAMALPRADDRPLVLAAYYPWFGMTDYDGPLLSDRPLVRRNTTGPLGVDAMLGEAAANGIDGFAVAYEGKRSDVETINHMLARAPEHGSVVSLYLETIGITDGASNKASALAAAIRTARPLLEHPSALRAADGVPVVFAFAMASISAADWDWVIRTVGPIHIVGDAPTGTHGKVQWGVHQYLPYNPATPAPEPSAFPAAVNRRAWAEALGVPPRLSVGTVWPGFDDRPLRGDDRPVVDRRGTQEYDDSWARAEAEDVDWVLITSWNEWFEGTSVEPSELHGSSALDATAALVQRFRSSR